MPTFWNDTTERMMLIKFLEQNMTIKLDVDVAISNWPSELGAAPTKRSLSDRFLLIKKNIRNSNVNPALGQGVSTTTNQSFPSTPQTVPPTPRRTSSTQKSSQAKAGVANSPNPISSARGTSTPAFKAKLLGTKATTNGKRKRGGKAKNSDEESMSDRDTESADETSVADHDDDDDDEQAETKSPTKPFTPAKTNKRGSLRRSKTPVNYNLSESTTTDDDDEGDSEEGEEQQKHRQPEANDITDKVNTKDRDEATVTNKRIKLEPDDSDEVGSDRTFDPRFQRESGRNDKKGKIGGMERVVEMDGDADDKDDTEMENDDDDDDDQD